MSNSIKLRGHQRGHLCKGNMNSFFFSTLKVKLKIFSCNMSDIRTSMLFLKWIRQREKTTE